MNASIKLLTFLLAAFIAAPTLAGALVYKWENDAGEVQYTDTAPPAGYEYSVIRTQGAPNSAKKAIQRLEEERAAQASSQDDNKQQAYEEQKKIAEEQARIKAENCKNAQQNLKVMEENARVRVLGDDGEFRYLSQEERNQHLQKAKDMIKNNCEAGA